MARDRRTDSPEEDNDLSLLRDYSKSLGHSADALLQSSKEFSSTTDSLNKGLLKTVSRLDQILGKAVDDFESTESSFSDSKSRLDKTHLDRLEKALGENQSERDLSIRKFSNTTSAFVKSFSQVANYAIAKFTAGFNSVVSSFEDNLTAITVRMQKSNQEYGNMLDAQTNRIRKDDLTTQFSQVDFIDQLNRVLDTGVRSVGGISAEDMAYRNMITNKLLPSINMNTRAYTRSSKLLGEEFSKSVVAIGKYTEGIYGMEGFDEGQFDAKLEQFGNSLMANASTREEAISNVENFAAFYQKIASEYGQEVAETISSQMIDQYYGLPGSNTMLATMGYGTPQEITNLLSGGAEKFDKFIEEFTGKYRAMDYNDPTMRAVLGNSLAGYDPRVAEAIKMTDEFGKQMPKLADVMENYNADKVYNEQMARLQGGDYQSKTAQQLKWNENATAKVGNFLAEHLPDVNGTLGLILGLMGTWFTAWLSGGRSGGLGGKGLSIDSLSSLGDKILGSRVDGSKIKVGKNLSTVNLPKEKSVDLSRVSSGGMESTSLATLGIAEVAGGAVAIGSGIKDLNDETVVNKGVGGTKIAGGALGVGGGVLGVAAAAGFASGPVGWIGLAVGAVGLLGAAAADSFKEVNSFTKGINEATSQIIQNIEAEKSNNREILDQIKNSDLSEQEKREQLKELGIVQGNLIDQYNLSADDLLTYSEKVLSSQEEVANRYSEIAKKDLDSQLKTKRGTIAEEMLGKFEGTLDSEKNKTEYETFVNQMKELGGSIQDETARAEFMAMLESVTKNGKISESERDAMLGNRNIWSMARSMISGDIDFKKNYFNVADDVGATNLALTRAGVSEGNRFDTTKYDAYSDRRLREAISYAEIYKNNEGFEKESALQSLSQILSDPGFKSSYQKYKDLNVVTNTEQGYISEGASAAGISGYKTGLLKVPRDNILARLHQGEMVLTSHQADSLRTAAEGEDMSGFLRGLLYGKEKLTTSEATALTQGSTSTDSVGSLIVDTIKSQTVEIVEVLNSILEVITKGTSSVPSTSNLSEGLVSFQGI